MQRPMCSANPPKRLGETAPTVRSVFNRIVATFSSPAMCVLLPDRAAEGLIVLGGKFFRLPTVGGPPARRLGVDPDVLVRRRHRLAHARFELLRGKMVLRKIP